jgi:AraC-like DNA-binding protein
LVGPVGHHGVVLLGDGSRARSALVDLAHQAARTATRFGFALHCGIADKKGSEPLPARYFAALWAAERALAEGRSVVGGEPQPRPTTARLRRLRTELAACVRQQPGLTSLRFEEYIQAVLAHSGYRYESVRPHLEAGFERLAESIGEGGLLDEKSASELWTSVERTVDASRTVEALIDAYRRVVIDLERALKSPTQARHDRSLRRALSFVREHLGEALPLARAARVAGFAPRHFSALFRKIEHTPYSAYLRDQRVARAKEMLRMTRLTVDRVGRSCGFRTRTHFHRAFRRAVGMTPIAYRES